MMLRIPTPRLSIGLTVALASVAAFACVIAPEAFAQDAVSRWPDRSVRLIVPFPAGSATDIAVRVVEPALSARLGQGVVIDNRSGASGAIGVDAVAKSVPDGYVSGLVTVSTQAIASSLGKKLPDDPVNDFAPIGMLASTPYVLVVYPELGVKTLAELIDLAKAKPGALNYGSAGPASMAHLAAALLATRAGLDLVHVPYRSSVHAVTDIIAGRVQMQFATIPPSMELVTAGKLRAIAVSSRRRTASLPDVPTVAEAGIAGFDASLWMGLVFPAGTPASIVSRFNAALNAALSDQKIRDGLAVQGMEPDPGPPEALTARTREDAGLWRDVIAKAGIKSE